MLYRAVWWSADFLMVCRALRYSTGVFGGLQGCLVVCRAVRWSTGLFGGLQSC